MALVHIPRREEDSMNHEVSMSGRELSGLIFPPPDIRNIIDRTANFVSQHGTVFETKIKEKERDNKKFKFMFPGDPYNVYYNMQIDAYQKTGETINFNKPKESEEAKEEKNGKFKFVAKDPPRKYCFSDDPSTLNTHDLAIMKLVARFTAMHGRNFASNLMNRENKSQTLDFMKNHHPNYPYYQKLIEQYRMILAMPKSAKTVLLDDMVYDKVYESLQYRTHYIEWENKQRTGKVSEQEAERKAYQQIDWHDFAIVQTLDFDNIDINTLPKFVKKVDLNERIKFSAPEIPENDLHYPDHSEQDYTPNVIPSAPIDEDEMEIEEEPRNNMPNLPSEVIIRDFDPKKQLKRVKNAETYVISPLTNEKIAADRLDKHVRFNTVTPQFKEQREREMALRMDEIEMIQGTDVSANLMVMAQRRKEIEEEGKNQKNKVEPVKFADIIAAQDRSSSHQVNNDYLTSVGVKRNPIHVPPPMIEPPQYFARNLMPPIQHNIPIYYPNPMIDNQFSNVMNMNATMIPPPINEMYMPGPSKKAKLEPEYVPEEEFLKTSPPEIQIVIEVPIDENGEAKMNVIQLSAEVRGSVSDVKTKIASQLNMVPSKLKLSQDGNFLKDNQSVASYNLRNGTVLSLSFKERGGKKK
uniref:Splicing factor 3A subunit 1 n=1 Tax=Rhabditophanes sp. KR3021 TaxID=114890 RepID=A0AC35TH99_9BILA